MSESDLRRSVLKALNGAGMHARPVENELAAGTPDVTYCCGWIELKQAKEWPKRTTTPLRLRHFTDAQRDWLEDRWRAGGLAFLLTQVGAAYLLHNGIAARRVGEMTRDEMLETADAVWVGKQGMLKGLPAWLKGRGTTSNRQSDS